MKLCFNGIDLDSGTGTRYPDNLPDFVRGLHLSEENGTLEKKKLEYGADDQDLEEAGWSIIYHPEENPAVLQAIEPLLNFRSRQTSLFSRIIYQPGESAIDFINRFQAGIGSVDPRKISYYLLIIGSPALISFDFQYELSIQYAVGRLAFNHPDDYKRYALAVLEHEQNTPTAAREFSIFGANNGDQLTEWSTKHLGRGLAQSLNPKPNRKYQPKQAWSTSYFEGSSANKNAYLDRLLGQSSDLIFSAGHGVFCSKNPHLREQYQGSLVCSDWNYNQPLKLKHCLTADDLPPDARLAGKICFFFACFTAGTPRFDTYRPQGKKRRELHPTPFVPALPQALLRSGALAVIGHVDQAFWHSFIWDEQYRDISHFTDTFRRLMDGERIGTAMNPFRQRFANMAAIMAGARFSPIPPTNEEQILKEWIAFHDSRQYTILGDPAVRFTTKAKP